MNTDNVIDSITQKPPSLIRSVSNATITSGAMASRQDYALMEALAAPDSTSTFGLLQSEWARMLDEHPDYSDELEAVDSHVCNLFTLAELIAKAPTGAIRQALRETYYCRSQMELAFGRDISPIEERAHLVFVGANAEWEILLSVYPTYSTWLSAIDRFTCPRSVLIEGMLYAPTESIRHALRETFCFREVAAMTTDHEFV